MVSSAQQQQQQESAGNNTTTPQHAAPGVSLVLSGTASPGASSTQSSSQPPQGNYTTTSSYSSATSATTSTKQQQQQVLSPNTPWTLGSTDGSYAMQLLVLSQQQQQQQVSSSDPAPSSSFVSATPAGVKIAALTGQASDDNSTVATPSEQAPFPVNNNNNVIITNKDAISIINNQRSLYQDRLFRQPSCSVESILAASCEVMGFDIAELWLRTGHKTHQLTNSHLRPTALEDTIRTELVDVYYGDKSSERTHRLSPALCKRAKEANDVVWITAHTLHGAEALRCSISNVRTAVAVPVCHEASNTNITILFFSIRRILVKPTAVEFLVHMSLSAGVASVNSLAEDGLMDRTTVAVAKANNNVSHSEHLPKTMTSNNDDDDSNNIGGGGGIAIRHQRMDRFSVTGAQLDLQWRQLLNVEYLTDGGNSWIHTAVFNGKPVVVKTLKPECQDVAVAINEIEGELAVHSRLNHKNICALIGAGTTSKGVRFVVLERLDGGTLTQMLGYDTRIRDRRRRFWRKKHFSYIDIIRIAKSIAEAMMYCHEEAIPGSVVMHRDLKPDNIGFTLDGTVKIIDFGLARIIESASVESNDVYVMSGETGSLRYMAPEIADGLPYNFCADVYSFGIILWELNAGKKPFDGLNRESFYERVVHGGERPSLHRKWSKELTSLMSECWDADMFNRPKFRDIVARLDALGDKEKGGSATKKKPFLPKISGMIDRHSTWF